MSRPAGRLFVLSAPSGAGKSSLARALVAGMPNATLSISHTTRVPRPGERQGVDYHFVSEDEFAHLVAADAFLEHARVFGNRYGTARAAVEALLRAGKDVIFDIDWQGARRIKALMPEARSVFILPPSREELERRLAARGQDPPEVIERRMHEAVAEMRHYPEFDYAIVNDRFEAALADLRAIVSGEAAKVRPLAVDLEALLRD